VAAGALWTEFCTHIKVGRCRSNPVDASVERDGTISTLLKLKFVNSFKMLLSIPTCAATTRAAGARWRR
jgi:hypothetical protein